MSVDPTLRTTEITETAQTAAPSKTWMELINSAQQHYERYFEVVGRVNKRYAELDRMAAGVGDSEFKIFWANLEVLRPSIYSRAPVPVVEPRFNDRSATHRKAAEVLERALITLTAETDLHAVLKLVRDDLARAGRGVAWVRINEDGDVEFEHVDDVDYLLDPVARKWKEVRWVARRSYMDRDRVEDMFPNADLKEVGFTEGAEKDIKGEEQVEIWEIWHRSEKKVVWVSDRFEGVLKESKPPVDLKGFFPCPPPVHSTLEPKTLIPVPDYVYYRDQLDEINALTRRIAALTEMIKLKGFYDAGSDAEVKSAIEAAFNSVSDTALLVGVKGLSSLMAGSGGRLVEWFPVEQAAQTVQMLIGIRRQLIEDIYQITGLSDIMRGSTVASETLGAQQLKAQYGSVRIRERQEETVRMARDLYRIAAEMLGEKVDFDKVLDLAQIVDLPKEADIKKQVKQIVDGAKQAAEQMMEQAQQSGQPPTPEMQQEAEQAAAAAQAQVDELEAQVTVEGVKKLLANEKARSFSLDVETDSTIEPDENAEKQRRTEFLGAVSGAIGNLSALVQTFPEAGPFAAAILRFTANGFRAGRELDQPIEDFAEMIAQRAQQPEGPTPEQQKAEAETQQKQAEFQLKQQEAAREDGVAQADIALKQAQAAKAQAEGQVIAQRAQAEGEAQADRLFSEALAGAMDQQSQFAAPFSAAGVL